MNPLSAGEHQLQYKIVYQEPSAGPLNKYVPGEAKYSLLVKPYYKYLLRVCGLGGCRWKGIFGLASIRFWFGHFISPMMSYLQTVL